MILHHTVDHQPNKEIACSIEREGLIPQVADVYRELVPQEIRDLPVVWLAEGIWQGFEFPVFEVDSKDLDSHRLYHCEMETPSWWVYQGAIEPHLVIRLDEVKE